MDASRRRSLPAGVSSQPAQPALRPLESAATEDGEVGPIAGETRLYILPGHQFRAIDILLTNFHLPRSTLLMLVSALAGLEWIRTA